MTAKQHPFCFAVFRLAALLAVLSFFAPVVHAAGLYRPPNMEKKIFDSKKVDLDKFDRAGLVASLVSIARDFNEEDDDIDYELRAHALAIAGRLDPDSEKFTSTRDQLVDDGKTISEDNASKSRTASRIYSGARTLARKDNKENKKCAAYCIDIALKADPDGKRAEALQDLREKLKEEDISVDWDGMLGSTAQPKNGGQGWWGQSDRSTYEEREEPMRGGKAEKFSRKQSSIFGLVVVTLSNGKHAGSASSIIASALRDEDVEGLKFKLNQKVGPMMANSLESIISFLTVTYEDTELVPSGYTIEIVFEDKDTLIDGPSAGTAMTLLLESLFTGEELDEEFACTGGITPAGKVTSIGGVAAKVRGATRRNCKIVGVPEANAKGVADNLLLHGIDQLLEIQIFSMKDIKQARAISRVKKSSEVQSTLDDFAAVAGVIKKDGEKMLKNNAVLKKLEGVVEKMPNHLSAKLLLEHARGTAPSNLSVSGSFHEIDSNASGVVSTAQMMGWREKYDHGPAAKETAEEAVEALEALEGKVDKRMNDYLEATIKLCKLVYEGRGDGSEEDFVKDIKKLFESVNSKRKKLLDDPELREEIMG